MSSGLVKGAVLQAGRVLPSIGALGTGAAGVSGQRVGSSLDITDAERQRHTDEQRKAQALAAELTALRDRAREEGHRQGMQQGLQQGLEQGLLRSLEQAREQATSEANATVASAVSRLGTLLCSMQSSFEFEREQASELLADVAFIAVNRLLGDALRDRELAAAAVRATLQTCDLWQSVTVEVHADDVQLLEAARHLLPNAAVRDIRIVASSTVELGGCRVSGKAGIADARWETQLPALKSALDAARRSWSETP